jgi:hypothetical protein
MAGDLEVDLTDEAPSRAADHSIDPPVTQHSATLRHPTPKVGKAPLFRNSDEELDNLGCENARLEKQHEIERLRSQVLGKNTHQHSESLNALAEPSAPKQPTPVELSTKRSTILSLNYGGHKQNDLAVFIRSVKNVLEFDVAVYPTESGQMMFAKQYPVDDAATVWDQYCARHPEGNHSWAAMKNLLYSRVAPTKHCTDAAFQKLHSAKQGPD